MTRLALLLLCLVALPARAARVAVVQSDDLPAYAGPVAAFVDGVGEPALVLNIHGRRNEAEAVAKRLKREDPEVVFALGAKAAWTVKRELPDTTVIYAMVLNPARYGIEGGRTMGVAATVPPAEYLSQFAGFFPDVKTVGVLSGPLATDERMAAMREVAARLGLTLVVEEVDSPRRARKAFYGMAPGVDALWLQPDRDMLTPEVFRVVTEEARRRRLPLLVETDNMVRAGALFAVVPDPEGIGRQAAEMARKVLEGGSPMVMRLADPRETHVVLNLRTIESAEIPFDPLLLDFVDVVVE